MVNPIFINCRPHNYSEYNQYVYTRNGKDYSISSGMLISLFNIYGYCVDPTSTQTLSLDNVNRLKYLAESVEDHKLVSVIDKLTNCKLQNSRLLDSEIKNYLLLSCSQKNDLKDILQRLLEISMYYTGWKGSTSEPYLNKIQDVTDIVSLELKLYPKINNIRDSNAYHQISNFPILDDHINEKYTIDKALTQLTDTSSSQIALKLIKTLYHYLTTVCNVKLPTLAHFNR